MAAAVLKLLPLNRQNLRLVYFLIDVGRAFLTIATYYEASSSAAAAAADCLPLAA